MNQLTEAVEKATQASELALSDIRDAHRIACDANPLAEILLMKITVQAAEVARHLAEIRRALA